MKASTSLGYKILSCTSEDPSHPIQSMQVSSIRSTGWQSQGTPRYPVDIILDLTSVVEIDTIQFVSHQYKIAARVDLYVASSDQKFQALGSFQFSDNSHTNYTARELKSVSLNGIKAQYVKISIPGCHANANNPQNQVGLVSLNIVGKGGLLKSQTVPAGGAGKASSGDGSDLLEQLERQKKEAVMREDFKTAEVLKQQIDRLRRSYDQVMQLQQQKNEAIAREDYTTAQRLKNEIDYLLGNAQRAPPPESPQRQPVRRQAPPPEPEPEIEPPRPVRRRQAPPPEPEEAAPPPRARAKPASPPIAVRSMPDPADERPIRPAADAGMDDIPAASPKRAPRAAPGNNDMQTEAEELSTANAQEAGLLVDLFGTKPVACFYSKAWNLRVQGINELADLIKGLRDNQSNAYYRFCYIMKHRVKETHKAVFTAAIEAVRNVGDALNLPASELSRSINQMIGQLIPKVGCSQKPLSDLACQFLLWLAEKDQFDIVVPILTRPMKNQNQYLIARAQLKMLRKLVFMKGAITSIPGLNLPTVMSVVVPCLESPKQEVRKAATKLVVALEFTCGSTIYQYFDKLHPRVKAAITEAIKASKEAGEAE